MNRLEKQQGMSLLRLVFVLVIIGSVGLLAIQLLPLYYDRSVIAKVVDEVAAEGNEEGKSKSSMWRDISKHLQLNNISYLKQDNVTFSQNDHGEIIITVDYEERRPLVGNLSLMVSFFHTTGH